MSEYNQLTFEIYTSVGNATPVLGTSGDLDRMQGLTFDTQYPGGLYGSCSFFLPRKPGDPWMIANGQRLVIRNGMSIVYEGYIIDFQPTRDEVVQGDQINCIGAWAYIAMRRAMNRRYVDNRLTEDVWVQDTLGAAAEKADVNREARIRITPKAEAWLNAQEAGVLYTCPTGETIKKITYTWTLAGANFKITFYDATNGETIISSAPGGPTAATYTPATPPAYTNFLLKSTAGVTPTSDGAYFGQITGVSVYAYTANSGNFADTLDKIALDIVATVTSLSSTTWGIGVSGSPLTLSPFVTEGYEMIADILTRAAEKGDAAGDRWACYLANSETAATPDGKPVLVVERQPLLTDWDYIVYFDSPNLVPSLQTTYTLEDLANWIVVRYTDQDGREQFLTPDDAGLSALTDATSTALYGRHYGIIDVGESLGGSTGVAYQAGVSWLAQYKNPRWKINSPITVAGWIQNKDGSLTPASEIRAGKRIKLGSYVDDGTNTWLTFLISQTSYDDESQTCSITIGPPPELNLPTFSFPELPPVDEPPAPTGGGGKKKKGNWKKKGLKTPNKKPR